MDDDEFKLLVASTAKAKESHYYYSGDLSAHVVSASFAQRLCVVELTVAESEISDAGCLDEGLVGTAADYWTSTLITALSQGRSALTTSLTVQALKPIAKGTKLHIVCTANDSLQPHAVATFACASDTSAVYAVATHTKYFKPRTK
ncbi:hypothetical protein GGI21_003629 [Coemansia aciculifera]|uniref:Uncharacterized protein n=1 Tax=Coemansia aciculifera TaxID=417176 RepID=A0ACC1MA08_9FUNG|nr:hypothetical protein IWW38_000377 [Coemansia aciculifera]KAJ2907695.1 hypothetical protein GGI21_003629 [Coemansia aciculifera]